MTLGQEGSTPVPSESETATPLICYQKALILSRGRARLFEKVAIGVEGVTLEVYEPHSPEAREAALRRFNEVNAPRLSSLIGMHDAPRQTQPRLGDESAVVVITNTRYPDIEDFYKALRTSEAQDAAAKIVEQQIPQAFPDAS